MACLDDAKTLDFLEGNLDAEAEAETKRHLDGCDECRTLVSAITKSMRGDTPGGGRGGDEPLRRGRTIDRYEVLDVIGAGGMGVVYAAYDPELDRKVALKLLRPTLDAPEGVDRLKRRLSREAKAMARLSHENVVTVYDAGTLEGQVFVAMELVKGVSLGVWLKSAPRRWQDVLAQYVHAGRGLAAAHAAGLVHRDFKPDNVLVGDDGRVRVTDFGLARSLTLPSPSGGMRAADSRARLESAPLMVESDPRSPIDAMTQAGVVAGTPKYMAPEQFLGKPADERTDQYAFSVALYEGLYGTSPFAARTLDERFDEVMSESVPLEPPKDARVPTWLRRVLVRGLAAAPEQRHPSMAALLTALQKQRWRMRRRVISSMGIAATILAGLLGYREARHERGALCTGAEAKLAGVWDFERRRDVERTFAAIDAPYAHDAWLNSARLLDDYAQRLTHMRTDACEATRVRGEQSEELLDLRVSCLDDRLRRVGALTKVLTEADSKVIEKSVEAVQALPSIDTCANAQALRGALRPPPDPATAARAAALRTMLADVGALERAGKYAEGLGLAENAVTQARALDYLPVEAEALDQLGTLQGDLEDAKSARATLEEAAAVAEAAAHHEIAARAWIRLAFFIGHGEAQYEQGYRWLRYAGAAIEHMGGNDELEAERVERLGILNWDEGKNADALANLKRALALFEKKLGPAHTTVATTLDAVAMVDDDLGRYEESRDLDRRALDIAERAYGPVHPHVGFILNNLGNSQWRLDQHEEALVSLRRSLEVVERTLGHDHPDVAIPLDTMGSVLTSLGRSDEALAVLKRAESIMIRAGKATETLYGEILNDLGELARERRVFDDALSSHRQALAVFESAVGVAHPSVAMTHHAIAEVWLAQGKFHEAVAEDTLALPIVEAVLEGQPSNAARVLTGLGEGALGLHDSEGAKGPLERALSLRSKLTGEAPDLARTQFALARALWATDRERSHDLAQQAKETYTRAGHCEKALAHVDEWLAAHAT